ncbi:OmpH family outer membrane protein [Flavisolibacter ginsenosidimutans]|uniref:OmpH family outer membrane protein n=1 Tax=Flavisolibacter ginsenosidimutans TaxID=661481 RepID=A0A5B8ULR2_9BACT|nr:OmpH family outer membrane protein [Flavisolibacter ginsenosidimutans]QEC56990.1 OmpH family outer membrane protein [Flavisolibacter ginsenosidimutans]
MNKFKLFFLAAIMILGASSMKVQGQKTGYFSIEEMLSLMPEVGKIDTLLQRYQVDSINTEFQSIIQDYNYKDSLLNKTDSTKIPQATRRQYRRDLEAITYQVQNWQQISQQAMQNKQQELLAPVYQKVYAALNQVAKDNGYAFVYRQEALLVAPPGDNLIPLVAKKLNVKLPAGALQNEGAATRPAGNARPAGAKKQ